MTSICICWGMSWPGHIGGWNCSTRLEADALVTCRVAHLTPPFVRARLPIEQGAVELGEAARVVAVEDERGKACDCHGRNVGRIADRY